MSFTDLVSVVNFVRHIRHKPKLHSLIQGVNDAKWSIHKILVLTADDQKGRFCSVWEQMTEIRSITVFISLNIIAHILYSAYYHTHIDFY